MRIPKLIRGDIIEIHWLDSMHTQGWMPPESADACVETPELEHVTAGYFWGQSKQHIAVCQSLNVHNASVDSVMNIPKVAMTKVIVVRALTVIKVAA